MTILTAGSLENKKSEKLLVHDVEASIPSTTFVQSRGPADADTDSHSFSTCLKVSIICLIGMLFVAALGLRSMYSEQEKAAMYRGTVNIPYDRIAERHKGVRIYEDSSDPDYLDSFLRSKVNDMVFFNEEFELDLSDAESYSKVTVPEFREGLSGHFLHDFQYNQSLIMDTLKKRCFVMPLDRSTVLQPRSMYDLFNKLASGYYNIDTQVVRKNMRVVVPPVTNFSELAPRIVNECANYNIFMLEKLQSGVFKRSISAPTATYGSFAGKHVVEYQMMNMDAADSYPDKV